MINSVLTDQEDSILEQVKSQFYYPTNQSIEQTVKVLVQQLDEETKAEIIPLVLGQIGYEQTLRRQYVLTSLYSNIDLLNKTAQENLVIQIADLQVNSTPPNAAIPDGSTALQSIGVVTQKIIEQAKIFKIVEIQLNSFLTLNRLTPQVQSLYNSLKKIPVTDLEKLKTDIQSLIDQLVSQGENIFNLNPEIPAQIVLQLKKAGLELSIGRYKTLGEKLNFLGVTLLITSVITGSVTQQLSLTAEEELLTIGRLMTAQDIQLINPSQ